MQLGCAAHHAVLDAGDDDGAVGLAFGGIALDKTFIGITVEAIMPARSSGISRAVSILIWRS
jgi:hypothetical protein